MDIYYTGNSVRLQLPPENYYKRMKRLIFVLILVHLFKPSMANTFQDIGWRDLTIPIEPTDDPFFSLPFEQKRNVETLINLERKKERGELLSEAERAEEATAISALLKDGISAEDILRKNSFFLEKLKLQRNSVRSEWNNQQVRIPGYILPLEFDGTHVTEFLLVPYVGACIHVPPPPPNQIIHVTTTNGYEAGGLFDPVWVEGTIEIESIKRSLYLKDGSADIEVSYSIWADSVELYSKRP